MVFVGVLAASNYTFVDVTRSRTLPDWTMSHVRMVEFWGGVPELVIPDNEKAAVHKARALGRVTPVSGARLHLDATIEDLNFMAPRGLDRSLIRRG